MKPLMTTSPLVSVYRKSTLASDSPSDPTSAYVVYFHHRPAHQIMTAADVHVGHTDTINHAVAHRPHAADAADSVACGTQAY